ncbi:AcrR family transcriptional regulator [Natronospira proteinivora]|uniref:AcrR family transcriptional regulator n=1 Tax=Natronospira proteinivora TaxID=1807133 RepID=A0ABT1G7J3_9GAMM|nr:TetR/AcrR family transcriptional regulator [Natronospira proteinivora]MCP1727271.1 AcrR family transcriptional regulator [Natronospira proteinivora]
MHEKKPRVRKSSEERKREILAAAQSEFARVGYRCTDVQNIADAVGVGKGTIYRHFPSKEGLFQAAVTQALDELKSAVESSVADLSDPLEILRTALCHYLTYFAANPDLVELFIHERAECGQAVKPLYFVRTDREQADWSALLQQLQAQGRVRQDHDCEQLSRILGEMLYGAVLSHRLSGSQTSLTEKGPVILDIFLNGIMEPDCQ